ncbi:GNAT family N-acetyltransferase [Jatrophihabitans telluris]|uniref:GNAT family N-acetyltransferase n=1 Tax=Jatrophihabitans telluris TaxID=2038343 RepID=A0ABY4QSF3_9ACTN|nr:GNAT family protein [Jatrophihabitans telluris]UQX86749.1 GNAT family N-acetyltransferase [Jatrophihabitans telluris]
MSTPVPPQDSPTAHTIGARVRPLATPAPDPLRWTAMESLAGTLVALVPLTMDHATGYLDAANSSDGAYEVFVHLGLGAPTTLAEARQHIAIALAGRARSERFPYAQLERGSGRFIGTTSLYEVSPATRSLAIGHTWLGRAWWRSGHNTDSKLTILRHAFDILGAVRVVWHTDILNERSQAAIERLGASREGVLRKHRIRPDGTWRDTVQYAMTDEDWPGAGAALAARLSPRAPRAAEETSTPGALPGDCADDSAAGVATD